MGGVKGVTSFALVVCSFRAVCMFSMNNFSFTNSESIKCILLIKLMCYSNNQRFYLPKDGITLMLRVYVFEQVDTPSTHIYTHTGYSRLYGTLEVWLADRPWTKPPLSQRQTSVRIYRFWQKEMSLNNLLQCQHWETLTTKKTK